MPDATTAATFCHDNIKRITDVHRHAIYGDGLTLPIIMAFDLTDARCAALAAAVATVAPGATVFVFAKPLDLLRNWVARNLGDDDLAKTLIAPANHGEVRCLVFTAGAADEPHIEQLDAAKQVEA